MTPSKVFTARADRMDGGLEMNTDRFDDFTKIASGKALRFERGAGIMTGPGYRSTATPVASVGYDGSLEANKVRPTGWVKLGTKIQYTHDGVTFYDTGVTVTVDKLSGFCEQSTGDVLYSNQTDTPLRFAVSKAQAAIAAADTTIDVGTAYIGKFSTVNPSTVYIRGDSITYTGVNTGNGTLTGVTGIQAGGHPIDSLIVQSSNPSTWVEEKGTILLPFQSRMLVMNVLNREEIVYYSAIEDLANPAFFYDFDGNGSYSSVMPGRVTGGIAGVGGAFIILDKGVQKILGFDDASGALLTEEISADEGAYNQKCVINMGGVAGFMGRKRFFPITLTLDPAAEAAPYLGDTFDHPIRPWLESHDDASDQASAYLKWDSTQKIMKMGAVVNGALETYVFDSQNPGFLPSENRSVGTSLMLNGKSYFGHRDNGKFYEDDFGRTNDGIPITHLISTTRIQNDKGRSYLKGQYFSYEGWMTIPTLHTLRIYVEGNSAPLLEEEYSYDDLITSQTGRPCGLRGIGLSTPGGSVGGTVTVYPFENTVIIRDINGDDLRFEWEVTGEGHFMQLNTWYCSAHPTRRQPRTKN